MSRLTIEDCLVAQSQRWHSRSIWSRALRISVSPLDARRQSSSSAYIVCQGSGCAQSFHAGYESSWRIEDPNDLLFASRYEPHSRQEGDVGHVIPVYLRPTKLVPCLQAVLASPRRMETSGLIHAVDEYMTFLAMLRD